MELLAAVLGVGALLLVLGVVVGAYVSRQRALCGRVGSFGCRWLADAPSTDAVGDDLLGTAGVARYCGDRLLWWRSVSLSPRPAQSWLRAELTVLDRVRLDHDDDTGHPVLLVTCRHQEVEFALVMSAPACAGLVSWIEAGPRPVGRVI